MLLTDAVDIVRLMNLLWAFDDRDPVSGESLQGASAGQTLDVLSPSASILLYEEGLDVVGRRADKGLVKCRTR